MNLLLDPKLIIVIAVVLVVVLLIAWLVGGYNQLVKLRNRVRNGWSQIDVQLRDAST